MNFNRFRNELQKFFYGRYGSDNLNIFLIVISFVISFFNYSIFITYPLLGYAIFRMLSKNIYKRQRELQIYNRIIGLRLSRLFHKTKTMLKKSYTNTSPGSYSAKNYINDKKDYKYFRCSKCRNKLKVPRNKGKLKITCPVCKTVTYKKT